MTRLTIALLAATAMVAPAVAADPMMEMPVYDEPVADWTGFYAGITAGATFNPAAPGIIEFDRNLDGVYGEPVAAFGSNFIGSREGGFTGGFELGYDWQVDSFVVGIAGDISYVDYADVQSGFSMTPAFYTETTTLNVLGTVRARAGFLLTDTILAYVHGGLAAGNVTTSFDTNNASAVRRGSASNYGYQVGVGFEGMVTEQVSLGIQYDYTNLGGRDFVTRFTAPGALAPATDIRGTDQIFDFHAIKGSLKYRF